MSALAFPTAPLTLPSRRRRHLSAVPDLPASPPRAVTEPITADESAPLRLTARGRVAVAVAGFVTALALAVGVGAIAGAVVGSGPEQSGTSVVVAPGQSLWSIASAHAAVGEDVRDVAADIAAINGLTSSTVQVGQEIQLPR